MTEGAPWKFLPCDTCCEGAPTCGHLCNWTDATAVTVTHGAVVGGTFESLYNHLSAGYLELQPAAGGLDAYVSFQLGDTYSPVSARAAGRYQAAPGKSIDVYLRDFVADDWEFAGTWGHAVVDGDTTYPLAAKHVSGTGEVRLRWKTAETNAAYRLYLDVARACHDREPFQVAVTINYPECPGFEAVYILDWADYLWLYEFPEPLPCGPYTATSIELHPMYVSWLDPWNINGMFMWCRIMMTGGFPLVRWWGYVYPPADCDFDELTLPFLYSDWHWPPTAGRPVVSAVH